MQDNQAQWERELEQLRAEYRTRYEVAEQNMRNIRNKLDMQIDMFTRIHQYGQMVFRLRTSEEIFAAIAEGVVDIFQLEVGAVFRLEVSGDAATLLGGCNVEAGALTLALPKSWVARKELWNPAEQTALWESPVERDSPLAVMNLAHAVYMPLLDNDSKLEGFILGGITEGSAEFYDFTPEEMESSFMVYCQQMNGIFNNADALRRAKEAGNAKGRFLANLSHEIRTPMNAIIGMVQIADRSDSMEELRRCMAQIESSSRLLLSLINDVLDISKIEEGKLSMADEPFTLAEVIESVCSNINPKAVEKRQAFEIVRTGEARDGYRGDAMRLTQVLLNLLSNAVKFTPEGGSVKLQVDTLSRDAEKALLRFTVSDTGIGIDEAFQKKLFSPFEQADSGISRQYGGTGLGLAISQRIVALMGGQIEVDSAVGKGSSFRFSILLRPDAVAAEQQQAELETPDYAGRTMLIVDDMPINREIVEALLADTGIAFEAAENGREAVDMVAASAPGHYDVILMDMQMPVMDGCSAARAIRALDRPDAKTVAIVAMTTNVFKEDVQNVLNAGMDGHIGKPVEYDTMIAVINQMLNR